MTTICAEIEEILRAEAAIRVYMSRLDTETIDDDGENALGIENVYVSISRREEIDKRRVRSHCNPCLAM